MLHLIPNLSGGGAERQLSYLAPELVRMGHDVHVAFSTEGPCKLELPGVVLHRLKARSNYDPYLFWQLVLLFHRIKPDIIQTWIMQMDILGGIAARLNGVPWVFREPSSPADYVPTWKHRLRSRVVSGASAVVSNSRGGDAYWKIRLPNSCRFIVQNGLSLPEINRIKAALPLGLAKTETPIVLYVGRPTFDLNATKNISTLLEALALVRKKHDVLGILCGEGLQGHGLKGVLGKLRLDADVYFTGYLPAASIWALMKRASVLVSLSAYEGCPNTVMEAMACGCPLVLSDIPSHRALLDENCALFVDPSNVEQTADRICQALCDPDASKARASRAKEKTREWSVSRLAREYERIYKEFI